jgi:hypothetical protein
MEQVELLEAPRRQERRGSLGTDPSSVVFWGRARYRAATGSAQLGSRGPDEPAGKHGRQLVLALH